MHQVINCEDINQVFMSVAACASDMYAEHAAKETQTYCPQLKVKLHLVDNQSRQMWTIEDDNGKFDESRIPLNGRGICSDTVRLRTMQKNVRDNVIDVALPLFSSVC